MTEEYCDDCKKLRSKGVQAWCSNCLIMTIDDYEHNDVCPLSWETGCCCMCADLDETQGETCPLCAEYLGLDQS